MALGKPWPAGVFSAIARRTTALRQARDTLLYGETVATQAQSHQPVIIEDLAVATAFRIAALIALLGRKALLSHQDLLDEIAHPKKGRARGH
jgi:hypothetical protein